MDASELSRSLRQLILALYGEFLSEDGNTVDYKGIASSDTWQVYCQRTTELKRIDLAALNCQEKVSPGQEERIFWVVEVSRTVLITRIW